MSAMFDSRVSISRVQSVTQLLLDKGARIDDVDVYGRHNL